MPSPYTNITELANAHVTLDRSLAEKLAELSRKQSRDHVTSEALEEGRMFGLRRMHSEMAQQRSLGQAIRMHPPLAKPW